MRPTQWESRDDVLPHSTLNSAPTPIGEIKQDPSRFLY